MYHVAAQAHAKSVPLVPVLQFLRSYFEITEQDSERTARERIAGKLLLLDVGFDEDLPLIFDFLAVPDPLRPAPRACRCRVRPQGSPPRSAPARAPR